MVATCVAPPPELPTAPLPDPVSHDNDDTYVQQYDEPALIEESCAASTPVQATVLEPLASPSIATSVKFQSCDHTPPVTPTAPCGPTAPAATDFWDDDDADDCDELLEWLRRQPILAYPDDHTVLVHAGIPPHWTIDTAERHAQELESQLQGSLKQLDRLLPNLYSKEADEWHASINGFTKMRAIANYFTRMRLCKQDGMLEFSFSGELDEPMPDGFFPWFEWPVPRARKILFGHWAALKAEIDLPTVRALDGGCVWGNHLLAYRLGDGQVITSSAHCHVDN